MQIQVIKSKIHRVTVTEADLNYVGSITVDEDLIDAAGMMQHQKVDVLNLNNGERLQTYIIKAERGSGVIGLNGPAALKVSIGDLIIIVAYGSLDEDEARNHEPTVIFPDKDNKIPSWLSTFSKKVLEINKEATKLLFVIQCW